MTSTKRRMMLLIPDVNPDSFVFFFERGDSGRSWSIRDYSIASQVKEYGPTHFLWVADEVRRKARHSLDAPSHRTADLTFWHQHTLNCNQRFLSGAEAAAFSQTVLPSIPSTPPVSKDAFAVLNLRQLLSQPKARKAHDMDRILHSQNSEDWVTWNFFQLLLAQHPNEWWRYIVDAARRRNSGLVFNFDGQPLPTPHLWSSVRSPVEYEVPSRVRMLAAADPAGAARARMAGPVEGASEIDIMFDHKQFLIFAEAKLGSDVSLSTTYDPRRNQIIRNIDCLISSAGNRTPLFWMFVRDDAADRAYVQLMKNYKADPGLLIRDLPHRDEETLRGIARNLTTLLWSDFSEMVNEPGGDAERTAVQREWARRIRG
jgi:hypothetical protein